MVCLSLTCRLFWYRLVSTRRDKGPLFAIGERRDSEDEREEEEIKRLLFLSLIDRNLTGHVLCYRCQRLHRRSRYERSWDRFNRRGRPCQEYQNEILVCGCWIVNHECLRLIIKAHDISPKHGLPLSTLAYKGYIDRYKPWARLVDISPRIINHQLFLRVEYPIPINLEAEPRDQLLGIYEFPCTHMWDANRDFFWFQINQARSIARDNQNTDTIHEWYEIPRCQSCATYARSRIEFDSTNRSGAHHRCTLKVRMWKNLGERNAPPWTQPWKGHTNCWREWRQRKPDLDGYFAELKEIFEAEER